MKRAERIFSLICDDVREEVGNKKSFMGIYQKDIILPKMPATLPQLHFVVFIENIKNKFSSIKIQFNFPKSEPKSLMLTPPKGTKRESNAMFTLGITSIKLESPGEGKFEVFFDDEAQPFLTHIFNIQSA